SGKSTTLAAIVDYANKFRKDHIITVEDPIEFVHKSQGCLVNHREVGVHTKSFASALRGALREDPDIILVGEMRDLETIELALTAAATADLDDILRAMLDFHESVSDLNITADKALQVESSGELIPVPFEPPIEKLTPFQTETIALLIIDGNRRLSEELIKSGSCDCSYSLGMKARFRANIFSQRGHYSIILRKLTTQIPTVEQLKLPPVFHTIAKEKT